MDPGATRTVYHDEVRIDDSTGSYESVVPGGANQPNQPPAFTSDPVVEINATQDVFYSSTLSDNATDPENDSLSFSKISGPAWLTVGFFGTLSGTPAIADLGLN